MTYNGCMEEHFLGKVATKAILVQDGKVLVARDLRTFLFIVRRLSSTQGDLLKFHQKSWPRQDGSTKP